MVPIQDRAHSGSCPFRIVPIQDRAHSGSSPFRIVSIRDAVHSGLCPFGLVSIRDGIHLGSCTSSPKGIVHLKTPTRDIFQSLPMVTKLNEANEF